LKAWKVAEVSAILASSPVISRRIRVRRKEREKEFESAKDGIL
jgi:hypothetical protein